MLLAFCPLIAGSRALQDEKLGAGCSEPPFHGAGRVGRKVTRATYSIRKLSQEALM